MSLYLAIKLLHILSATVLFGTGIGTAFFMLRAYLSGNDQAMAVTASGVVLADWMFTTPAVGVQLATGLWLTRQLGISFGSTWFVSVIGLFMLIGACWIPVLWIQTRVKALAGAGAPRESYRHLMRWWMALGIPAFSAMVVIFYLMVTRIGAYV